MTPDGKQPTQYKRYYDLTTWLITQLAFSFTTAPFILLTFNSSILVWRRVYFYCIIGVTLSSLFLLTSGKTYLQKKVKARTTVVKPEIKRTGSHEGMEGATLGVPDEPGREFDEMVDEITEEVRKRKGSAIGPDGMALRRMVEETLNRNLGSGGEERKGQ